MFLTMYYWKQTTKSLKINRNGEDFASFEVEEVESVRAPRNNQLNDESDISVELSDSGESSGSESEEIAKELVWSRDDSPVEVHEFTQRTGATSWTPEDRTALDFLLLNFQKICLNFSSEKQPKCWTVDTSEARPTLVSDNMWRNGCLHRDKHLLWDQDLTWNKALLVEKFIPSCPICAESLAKKPFWKN